MSQRKLVETLLLEHGVDTLSYFHLQHDRMYFFSPSGKSCLSYRIFHNVVVVGGDPLGPESEIPLLLETFLDFVSSWHLLPLFMGLSKRHMDIVKSKRLKVAKIGEEAILSLETFDAMKLKKKVKRAVRHVGECGVEIFFFTSANIPLSIHQQIVSISQEWLQEKGGKEKGFSMTLKRLPNAEDKDCFYAVALQNGEVLGYLCFVPSYGSKSLSLDHIRSKKNMPNGLHEFLIVKSAEYFKAHKIQQVSLNFATFANIVETSSKIHVKKHFFAMLMKLYKCDTLRAFNEKFAPKWESRYVAYVSLKHLPYYLRAVLSAER